MNHYRSIYYSSIAILSILYFSFGITFGFDVPNHDERVTDQADIFSDQEELYLEAQLEALEEVHKAEIAILTLSSLAGEDIAQVAYQIATDRGVGKDEADNGILVVIAPNERERRIEVGYGLEGAVPDITAFQLGRQDLVPAFREQQYFQGVTTLVEHLSGAVAGEYNPDQYAGSHQGSVVQSFLMGLFFLSFLGFFISTFVRSGIDTSKKDMSDTKKKDIFQAGSFVNMVPGLFIVGARGLLYLIPLYYIWKWMITSDKINIVTSNGGRSSGGGSSFGGGFSGFGGGSFGGGGASGGW